MKPLKPPQYGGLVSIFKVDYFPITPSSRIPLFGGVLRYLQIAFQNHPLAVAGLELSFGFFGLMIFVFSVMRALGNVDRWIGW